MRRFTKFSDTGSPIAHIERRLRSFACVWRNDSEVGLLLYTFKPMTHIGRGSVFSGELTSDEDLTIEGIVKGNVQMRDAVLTLAEPARVEADIHGVRVQVHGSLKGSITASTRIELGPTARVEGNLSADQVVIADGARFDGRIDMGRRTVALKMAQYKAGQTAGA